MSQHPARCGLCRFWPRYPYAEINDLEAGLSGDNRSECRRHSPIVGPIHGQTAWPWTGNADWCGDFEPRPPAESDPSDGAPLRVKKG